MSLFHICLAVAVDCGFRTPPCSAAVYDERTVLLAGRVLRCFWTACMALGWGHDIQIYGRPKSLMYLMHSMYVRIVHVEKHLKDFGQGF